MKSLSNILFTPVDALDDFALDMYTDPAAIEEAMSKFESGSLALLASVTVRISKDKSLISKVKKVFKDFLLTIDIKAQLKLLSGYLSKAALRFQHLRDSIFQSLTILFGMCSSLPAYIYAAIFGSSSTRIFS